MLWYAFRRLAYGLMVILAVIIGISGLIYLSPVDPAQLTFGQRADVATVQAKTEELGLNQPLWLQLGAYLSDLSPVSCLNIRRTDIRNISYVCLFQKSEFQFWVIKWPYLRTSYQSGRPVSHILARAIPPTALLAVLAMCLAMVLGLPLGIISAVYPKTRIDRAISWFTVLGYSLPTYVVAMVLALILGYWLGPWTGLQVQGSLYELDDFGDWQLEIRNLILPVLALGLRPVALITQLTRSTLLEVLSQDFVRTAQAKGLPPRKVLLQHALRNALNPLSTAASSWFAALLTGAFFVENVFSFKGLGEVTVQALLNYDLPVVLGCVIFTASVFVVINLWTDFLYVWLDPRIRLE
ncbi:MAG: ABC transporter permease [Bacteroidetes bacterium]|nr:ABC transporter permease [Bacteroidota bacterium]